MCCQVDLVIGKGHKGGFATLAERKSRLYLALPIANKTAQNANDAINKLLTPHKHWVKTLTFDNGREFSTGALINVNAIRYPTSIIIFAIAFSIFLMLMTQVFVKRSAYRFALFNPTRKRSETCKNIRNWPANKDTIFTY
jgi:hypothetical protein